uniref:Actin-related protein 2/3 complex subunit 3 n=1 Tax=Panagrolaimus superbus TaxID=310955 RepID=A0A914XV01_9BILA
MIYDKKYHSSFNDTDYPSIAQMMSLPFKNFYDVKNTNKDIIDEALGFYQQAMDADTYLIHGDADRTLIYLFLFITECCKCCLYAKDALTAWERLRLLVDEKILPIPGDVGFPFNAYYGRPKNAREKYFLRSYLMQLEQECIERFFMIVYKNTDDPREDWLSFGKQTFLGHHFKLNA